MTRWNDNLHNNDDSIITFNDGTRDKYRTDGSFERLYDNDDTTMITKGVDGQILNKNTEEDLTGSLVTPANISEATAALERQAAERKAVQAEIEK